ncbi:MAG TPA: hypothetical protein VFS82_08215, partial [Lysobacter sp.]|nr:hypothetical protein [Lysobacter sp.]
MSRFLLRFLDALAPGGLERSVGREQLVKLQLFLPALEHHFLQDLLERQALVIRVGVCFVLLSVIRMRADTVHYVHELHPLLLRRRAPALEPALVEGADDLVQRILLRLAAVVTTRVGILRIQLGLGSIQADAVVEFGPLQAIGRQVHGFQQLVQRVLVGILDPQFRHQKLEEPEQLFPVNDLERKDRRHLAIDLHELARLDLEVDLSLFFQFQLMVEAV